MRHVRMLGMCLVAAFALGAMAASSALAEEEKPLSQKQLEKLYAPFSACPYNNPEVDICVHAQTAGGKNGGQFTVGSITIPLSKKITLQGGLTEAGYDNETELQGFFPPENGEGALISPPLSVPGGFTHRIAPQPFWPAALKESYANAKKNKELTATETLELAGTPELSPDNLLVEERTAFELPMKVQVNSPWLATLGSGPCYVGSDEHPIIVDLTSGESIAPFPFEYNESRGQNFSELHFKDNFDYVELLDSTLVNNTYAVTTGAEGCGGEFERYLDPAISAAAGVPDAAGSNNVILTGTQKVSVSERVKEVIG